MFAVSRPVTRSKQKVSDLSETCPGRARIDRLQGAHLPGQPSRPIPRRWNFTAKGENALHAKLHLIVVIELETQDDRASCHAAADDVDPHGFTGPLDHQMVAR